MGTSSPQPMKLVRSGQGWSSGEDLCRKTVQMYPGEKHVTDESKS